MSHPADSYDASIGSDVRALARNWKVLLATAVAGGVIGIGASFLIAPTFTARTSILPPQQQQSAAASALSSLGALAGLATGGAVKSPADQYVALMLSDTVVQRLVEQFELVNVFATKFQFEAREKLRQNSRFTVGKKDGLIVVEVDDKDPVRAAKIANAYIEELRRISGTIALTEAQQRRKFFEGELRTSRDKLTTAQTELQQAGLDPGAMKIEPKSVADAYSKAQTDLASAEVRLQSMRVNLQDSSPEVVSQTAVVAALRKRLNQLEDSTKALASGHSYVSKFREYKYQETLFELFSRQYEAARLDESREGALIQVLDPAMEPEHKSKPKRALIGLATALASFFGACVFVAARARQAALRI